LKLTFSLDKLVFSFQNLKSTSLLLRKLWNPKAHLSVYVWAFDEEDMGRNMVYDRALGQGLFVVELFNKKIMKCMQVRLKLKEKNDNGITEYDLLCGSDDDDEYKPKI